MSDCCDNNQFSGYDLAVIGAGSAGFSAAITAAEAGARVALIGHGTIGGTCVNVGCVPSKALIRSTQLLHNARTAVRFNGIELSAQISDWSAAIRQKQDLVEDLRKAKYIDILPAYDRVTYLEGQAAFFDDGSLGVDGNSIEANKVIIATGSSPSIVPIDGLDDVDYLTSTTAFELEELPQSMIIIGAGYVGTEIAQIFARAGVRIYLISRRGVLPEAEPEIGEALGEYFVEEGLEVISGITYDRIEAQEGIITLHLNGKYGSEKISAEKIVMATGRMPNIDQLNLEAAGIGLSTNSGIEVDAQMRTTAKNIYAVGDVTGRDQFVYMAAYGAKIAAKNAMNGDTLSYDNSLMPSVVFSDPQVASVGYTEIQARAAGIHVKTSVLALEHVPRALAARDTRGLIKLVADASTKKLIGAHILAPEGADSIQTAVMAISAGMTYEELGAMIFPYLTTVEGLKLAAQTFDMDVAKLSCCAG